MRINNAVYVGTFIVSIALIAGVMTSCNKNAAKVESGSDISSTESGFVSESKITTSPTTLRVTTATVGTTLSTTVGTTPTETTALPTTTTSTITTAVPPTTTTSATAASATTTTATPTTKATDAPTTPTTKATTAPTTPTTKTTTAPTSDPLIGNTGDISISWLINSGRPYTWVTWGGATTYTDTISGNVYDSNGLYLGNTGDWSQ